MQEQNEVTDEAFLEMCMEQLGAISARHGHKYNSAEEIIGAVSKSHFKLVHAVNGGNGKVTSLVLSELVGLAVVAIRGARSDMHGSENNNVHGLQ